MKLPLRLPPFGRLAQLVRALVSHTRGHWFESGIAHSSKPTDPHQSRRVDSGGEKTEEMIEFRRVHRESMRPSFLPS